jgi:hypothetical protein
MTITGKRSGTNTITPTTFKTDKRKAKILLIFSALYREFKWASSE